LRYPGATVFDGMIIWSGRPQVGPKAPLGAYQVRMTIGDHQETKSFSILMDPNLQGVTAEDLQAQFDLAMQIRDKTSAANEAVIRIRQMRKELQERMTKTASEDLKKLMQAMINQMQPIEEDLYQVRNQSNQDPLNFPIKLNNRLASLRRSVETGDAKPTTGAHQVFNELSAELKGHLEKLQMVINNQLPAINQALAKEGLREIASGGRP
jgi:hypothetical protein